MNSLKENKLKIALLGNPNAGKSTLFNALTGLNQKTGNYAGVTVDRIDGKFKINQENIITECTITDLPGTYSLYPKSLDERVTCGYLLLENIDVALVVVDATNLKRNLLLATQIIDLKFRTVIALNFTDETNLQNIKIDVNGLEQDLGVPIVCIDSRNKVGFNELHIALLKAKVSTSIFYDVASFPNLTYKEFVSKGLSTALNTEENKDKIFRFSQLNYLTKKHVKSPNELSLKILSNKIDKITTHKVLGYLVLLAVLFTVFQLIFFVAEYPMGWIENAFLALQNFVHDNLPEGKINDLVVNGIIAGISGVVMFIPQIALLFLFIAVLEDSGYMARASFIMDKLMRGFGLNGKSVIPLISGTACAVPSIMATRGISNLKERLITIFILPLISCSARLPVYTLLIAVLYPNDYFLGIFNLKGLALMALYFVGFIMALLIALIMHLYIKPSEKSFFIMEMPVYRIPQARSIFLTVLNKVKVFVIDAGKIIFALSIILWFLGSYGPGDNYSDLAKQELEVKARPMHPLNDSLRKVIQTQKLENSYIGVFGKAIEPAIKPLGFDWKIGIALITSFAAREVFVGTMSTIYQTGDSEDLMSIKEKLIFERRENGSPTYSTATCWALLIFYAFAMQCISTVATTKRETKSWRWAAIQFFSFTALAYLSAFLVYQLLA